MKPETGSGMQKVEVKEGALREPRDGRRVPHRHGPQTHVNPIIGRKLGSLSAAGLLLWKRHVCQEDWTFEVKKMHFSKNFVGRSSL